MNIFECNSGELNRDGYRCFFNVIGGNWIGMDMHVFGCWKWDSFLGIFR